MQTKNSEITGRAVKGARPRLSDDDRALIERGVESIVKYFVGRHRLADEDDVRQEAWCAALTAAAAHDPSRGYDLKNWAIYVMRRQVGASIARWSSLVSLSRGAASRGVGRQFQSRASVCAEDHPADGADPESVALAREAAAVAERGREAMRCLASRMLASERPAGAQIMMHVDAGVPLERAVSMAVLDHGSAARRAAERLVRHAAEALEA